MSYTNVPIAAAGDWIDDAYINTYLGDNFRALFSSLTGAGQLLASTAINTLSKVPVTGNNGYILTEDTSQATKMKFAAAPIGLPAGGSALQYPRKNAANNAYEWATLADGFPAGGAAYQGVRLDSAGTSKEWTALLNIISRQGGSATVWSTAGSTTRAVPHAGCQVGAVSITMTGAGPASGSAAITFPTPFAQAPLVFLSMSSSQSSGVWTQLEFFSVTASGMSIWIGHNANSSSYNPRTVNWMAIGPM